MKYCDMHCDALTNGGVLQVTGDRLRAGGCFLQCFAAFLSSPEERFSAALRLTEKFYALCAAEGFSPVRKFSDLKEGVNALLTVEGGGAIEGSLEKLRALYGKGVRMITLTWNDPNEIGFPNMPGGVKGLSAARETERGLTPFGREAVGEMLRLGMIVDVSHGSDRLFSDTAELAGRAGVPFVASHSNAQSAFDCPRNLTDGQLKTLSGCGGVAGLNFCADFLSGDKTAEGQRAAVFRHLHAMIGAGGEDLPAVGSDFDGTSPNAFIGNPADMPRFLSLLADEFGARIAEKIACGNFLRVFREVCG